MRTVDEQRRSAYLNLIQALLNCRSGEEVAETLAANEELIDADLVRVMERKATELSEQGEKVAAASLQNMAAELAMMLGGSSGVSPDEYFAVLQEVIQAETESNGNAQVVYPILQRHQDKLDANFARILEAWARNIFSQANSEQVQALAALIQQLSIHIQQFPLGSRANNLEIAIIGYSLALEVYTKEAFPVEWAAIQNNLAAAYGERIRGEKAENLERAIAACGAALEVYTKEAFPVNWATTQNNLGNAYLYRIRGEKAENLERALAAFQKALEVYIKEAFTQNHAETLFNLGITYQEAKQCQNNLSVPVNSLQLFFISLDALKFLVHIPLHKAFTAIIMQCKCV